MVADLVVEIAEPLVDHAVHQEDRSSYHLVCTFNQSHELGSQIPLETLDFTP